MYQDQETPQHLFDQNSIRSLVPDEIKPIIQESLSRSSQNFDILINKLINDGELTDIELQQLSEHQKIAIQEIKQRIQNKTKRPDQYQKMFFKKAFKHVQHSFFKKNKKNRSRRMSHFYHHYFDEIRKSSTRQLSQFYHPDKKSKPGLVKGQKSFNASYIKLILQSRNFKKQCLNYKNIFEKQCKRERNKKVKTFSTSIFNMIEKNKNEVNKFVNFLRSSKCKVPWTNRQIEQAQKSSAQFFSENEDQGTGTGDTSSIVSDHISHNTTLHPYQFPYDANRQKIKTTDMLSEIEMQNSLIHQPYKTIIQPFPDPDLKEFFNLSPIKDLYFMEVDILQVCSEKKSCQKSSKSYYSEGQEQKNILARKDEENEQMINQLVDLELQDSLQQRTVDQEKIASFIDDN